MKSGALPVGDGALTCGNDHLTAGQAWVIWLIQSDENKQRDYPRPLVLFRIYQ